MKKHMPARETKANDWPLVDEYFDSLHDAFINNRIDFDQYKKWPTHMIGAANNYGIEHVHSSIEVMFADHPLTLKRKT